MLMRFPERRQLTNQRITPLSWAGYSQRNRITLYHMAEELCHPHALYEQIPFCAESYKLLKDMPLEERIPIQNRLLETIDHSTNLTPYFGVIRETHAQTIQRELKHCTMTMMQLLKVLANGDSQGAEFNRICTAMPPELADRFRSAVTTSRHNYTQFNGKDAYKNNVDQPLYLEMGTDIMVNGMDMIMAEFQVRYSAPYPHLLRNLNNGFQANFPELFESLSLKVDDFPARRGRMLQRAFDIFAQNKKNTPKKIVIDGWAYLQNAGANWEQLAREMRADYIVFDDLEIGKHARELEEAYPADTSLFVFNQVPVYQLDPVDAFYDCFNEERMENYDELGWPGMNERYRAGDVFFAHGPITDIVNDKALYEFLPELCRIFFETELRIPIATSTPCWDLDNPEKLNQVAIAWALQNQNECVIAHRYLEGGSGIRVGTALSSEDWESFISTYVSDRPYLYVLRDYFPMSPDLSMRVLTSSLSESMEMNSPVEFACADSFLARYSTQKPLTLKNSRCLIIFQSGQQQ
jgi:hypothetical protein